MGGRLILLLLLMLPISSVALDNSSRAYFAAPGNASRIDLEGSDFLMVPNMTYSGASDKTHLFDRLPIYPANRSINGTFSSKSKIMVCVSPFNISEYQTSLPEKSRFARMDCAEIQVASNDSNTTSFAIPGKPRGTYTLNVVDENRSTILIRQPFLVTEGELVLNMDSKVTSSDPFIRVKMNTTALKNQSKFFAAFMIPRKDYANLSLKLADSNTTDGIDLNLSLGSKSLEMQGTSRISSELLMNLLPLLPRNSAVGLQESTEPGVDLILMADQLWEKGQYVLTSGVYSPIIGLVGIKQTNVEVI